MGSNTHITQSVTPGPGCPKSQTTGNYVSMHAKYRSDDTSVSNWCTEEKSRKTPREGKKTNRQSKWEFWNPDQDTPSCTVQAPLLHISIQATGSPQLLTRRQREREKKPLWWHWLLTELTPPGLSQTTVERPTAIWEVLFWWKHNSRRVFERTSTLFQSTAFKSLKGQVQLQHQCLRCFIKKEQILK